MSKFCIVLKDIVRLSSRRLHEPGVDSDFMKSYQIP